MVHGSVGLDWFSIFLFERRVLQLHAYLNTLIFFSFLCAALCRLSRVVLNLLPISWLRWLKLPGQRTNFFINAMYIYTTLIVPRAFTQL
jgi:hypothetical protein